MNYEVAVQIDRNPLCKTCKHYKSKQLKHFGIDCVAHYCNGELFSTGYIKVGSEFEGYAIPKTCPKHKEYKELRESLGYTGERRVVLATPVEGKRGRGRPRKYAI